MAALLRSRAFQSSLLLTNLLATTSGIYLLRDHHIYNLEEHEARMDELEGTLRGHIGIIEEALDRLEGKATEADRGKKMNELYGRRGRDDKKDGQKEGAKS